MHIEADLDEIHAAKLLELQTRLKKSVSEIISDLIDTSTSISEISVKDEISPIFQAFETAGLIGCISTNEELSTNYKEKLDFLNKVGSNR